MSQPVRQPSFAAGELAPNLWARTDLDKYAIGARGLLNNVISPVGEPSNRAGTYLVDNTLGDAVARLRDFFFSTTDTLLMAFTAGKIRFYARDANGVPGVVESSPGVPVEVDTPYAAADLKFLRFAQVGDVVRIACKGYDAYDLTRTGVAPITFTFVAVSFDVSVFPAVFGVFLLPPLSTEELPTYPGKTWKYKATALLEDAKGNVWETKAYDITQARFAAWSAVTVYSGGQGTFYAGLNWTKDPTAPPGANEVPGVAVFDPGGGFIPVWNHLGDGSTTIPANLPRYPNKPQTVWLDGALVGDPGYRLLAIRVYCGRGKLFGYLGEIENGLFLDTGDTPDWSRTPPKGQNPFKVYDWQDVLLRTEKPAVVTFFEQRCVLARTGERPGFIFFSATNSYNNYDEHDLALAEDALSLELASSRWEEIRALIPGRTLLAFTSGGEWLISGGADGASLTPLSFAARPRTERGSSWVEPIKVGDDEVLFIPPSGNVVRELALDGASGKYSAADVTILSKHLFEGRQVVDWDWQEEPWSIFWVVFDDGTMASLTYAKDQAMAAWTPHETDGLVEAICCVREGAEDAVYLVVNRNGQRLIERMASRLVTDVKLGLFLDSAVGYNGSPATHFSGLDHLEGRTVSALADGYVVSDLVVAGGAIDLSADDFPDGASIVWVGLPYVSELELLDLPQGEGRNRVKTVKSVSIEYRGRPGGYVGEAFDKKLSEWRERRLEHGAGAIPIEDGQKTIAITSTWNSGGRAVIRHVDPVPLSILSVSREVEYGGTQG